MKSVDIEIEAYTDGTGSKKRNDVLSKERANEVKKELEKDLKADGVTATVTAKGMGANGAKAGVKDATKRHAVINLMTP